MPIATEMKELTRDIASSHADRMRRISEIREEANQTRGEAHHLIEGFQASRQELKAELKEASAAWQELASAKAKKQRKED